MADASWEDNPAVVLDNGSGIVKCGFAGDEFPRVAFASVVGHPRAGGEPVVGDDALVARGVTLRYPLEHGVVADWEDLERVWRRCYAELSADPTLQPLLVTEAPMNPKVNREKLAEVAFERLGVPAVQVQIQAVLALYSAGRITGCVVDSGDGVTHSVPIYEGHAMPTAIRRLDLAGRDLTEWMMELLSDETERPFTTSADREVARNIKEALGYVAQDFDAELEAADSGGEAAERLAAPFKLPDGNTINVGRSRFCCTEALFNPSVADKTCLSLQELVHESISECPIDIRRPLLNDVVLSGGSTMFRGLPERLKKELSHLANRKAHDDVRVIAAGERKFSVWMGAATLASLTSFSAEWITRQEYEEEGAQVMHRRCNAHDFAGK